MQFAFLGIKKSVRWSKEATQVLDKPLWASDATEAFASLCLFVNRPNDAIRPFLASGFCKGCCGINRVTPN